MSLFSHKDRYNRFVRKAFHIRLRSAEDFAQMGQGISDSLFQATLRRPKSQLAVSERPIESNDEGTFIVYQEARALTSRRRSVQS